MPLDDFLGDGEPDAVSLIFIPRVKPLEHLKNSLGILRVDTDAIIAY